MFGIFSSFASAACEICASIGGAVMESIGSVIAEIPTIFPHLTIAVIDVVINIIQKVAELLIGKPEEEKPEELGLKAEEAELKPEDFNSIEEYIAYLRTEIQADQEKLNTLSSEDRIKYAAVGVSLYVKQAEEKYEMKLGPLFWNGVAYTDLTVDQTVALINAMKNNGITDASQYTDFLGNKLQPGIEKFNMYQSIKSMLNPDETRSLEQVEDDISQMREKYANREQ